MEHQVPQFIEVEDKIVGPLSLRQFIYLAGGGGICVILFLYLPIFVSFLLILPIGGLAVALAFYKVNGKPFADVLESAFNYYTRAKLFLWKREETKEKIERAENAAAALEAQKVAAAAERRTPRLTSGKLHDLAWSLDISKKDEGSTL